MRKLILEEWISLDGNAAAENDNLDFFTQYTPDQNKDANANQMEFIKTVDTFIIGRRTYEMFIKFWPEATSDKEPIADTLNSLNKIVVSNSLKEAPWGKWPAAKIIGGDIVEEIKKLKEAPGKNIVVWGSISLAQALIKANLLDEYRIQVCPALTGGGRPLFPDGFDAASLKLIESIKFQTGIVHFHYQLDAAK